MKQYYFITVLKLNGVLRDIDDNNESVIEKLSNLGKISRIIKEIRHYYMMELLPKLENCFDALKNGCFTK